MQYAQALILDIICFRHPEEARNGTVTGRKCLVDCYFLHNIRLMVFQL